MQEKPYFCHGRIRIGTYAAVMDMMMEARKKFYLVKVPVLVLQSEKDVANNVKRVNEFMKEVDVQDKTIQNIIYHIIQFLLKIPLRRYA